MSQLISRLWASLELKMAHAYRGYGREYFLPAPQRKIKY